MKILWGYLTAAIFGGFTWILMKMGEKYADLLDMVYPYVTRTVQGMLTQWSSTVDLCVWQIAVIVFAVVVLTALVLVVIFKKNVLQWLGWVLGVVSIVAFLHTGIYGLNYYNGDIADDLRMEIADYTQTELEAATEYYRDMANGLATRLPRNEQGAVKFSSFEDLSEKTGTGFRKLVLDRSFSIFGGDYTPVKKLGWADMYSSMGITGFTCFLTGEAAVNPQIPAQSLPFTMAHEMAHRLCVAREDDANFAAYLACEASTSREYRYSGYFMAYQYCYNALHRMDPVAAKRISSGCSLELTWDLNAYNQFFADRRDETATKVANTTNDTYLKVSGDSDGVASYGAVCDLLVNWYLHEYAEAEEEEYKFDPYDETQVDLSGLPNYVPAETEPAA